MKKNPLYIIVCILIGIDFILVAFPQILGWSRADVWVIGIPLSQFCIYLFSLIIVLLMGVLYLLDYQEEKKKALKKLEEDRKGGNA